jgi:hypothetical protein
MAPRHHSDSIVTISFRRLQTDQSKTLLGGTALFVKNPRTSLSTVAKQRFVADLMFVRQIPATVVSNEQKDGRYQLVVYIEPAKFRGPFLKLRFRDNVPVKGTYEDGRLELTYARRLEFESGDTFPVWVD